MASTSFYIAGPLFNAYEQAFQAQIAAALALFGTAYLPQRDVVPSGDIFAQCCAGVAQSKIIIANLSGADTDSGTAFEVGYAYALGKPIYAIRSELAFNFPDRITYPNLMLKASTILLPSLESLVERLRADFPAGV
jgi:nucleoside 2-deoxyribosyltransferase